MECSTLNILSALLFALLVFSVKSDSTATENTFIPSKYLLEIFTKDEHFKKADNKTLKYDGTVTINFENKAAKEAGTAGRLEIVLDTNPDSDIKSIKLEDVTAEPKLIDAKKELKGDKLIITCENCTKVVKFKLEVKFSNPFGNDMTGFYRSSYKEGADERWLLTTHFEPIFARKAFPCFDQPHLKAIFEIHVTVPSSVNTVLSNTELGVKTDNKNEKIFHFKPTTLPMSTYLVAFTASNLEATKEEEFISDYEPLGTKAPKKLKTYGRREIINKKEGELAQRIGKKAILKLTEYLDLGYAFTKIDQVGIPDFSAGAMENWGHISFREKSLFFDNNLGTAMTKQANILTITHELVHQWFGNLVTLESWDYIWLNEAFANYIEYIIADKFDETQSWNLLNQMVVNEIHLRAFETDGLTSSKPLNNKIQNESLIFSSFNDIPYSKGAAVLRMWNLQMKDNGFQKSLQRYLKDRQKKTANPSQLFAAFKTVTNMNENNFKSWTDQVGYPVVEVKKVKGGYSLSQTRFLWEKKTETNSTYWEIPITYASDNLTDFTTIPTKWLQKEAQTVNHTCKWIIFNNQQAGYYRVSYEVENWKALSKALLEPNYSKIPELNRAQILNDVFSLARSLQKEYVDYSIALELATYLRNETSFIPWKTALNAFEFIRTKIYNEKTKDKFREYVLELVKPHFKGFNSSALNHVQKLMNVEISRWACILDFEPCVKDAKDIFNKTSYNKFPDTQEIILCTVVRNDKNAWDAVLNKYKAEEDSSLKIMYINALGCSNDEAQIKEFLNKTLSCDSSIRKQDLSYALSSVYNGNLKNIEVAFEFIEKNYERIANEYGGINPLGKAVVGIARKLKTQAHLKRLTTLADKIKSNSKLSAATESVDNALNIAQSNINWVNGRMKQVNKYLNSGSFLTYSLTLLSLSILSVFQF